MDAHKHNSRHKVCDPHLAKSSCYGVTQGNSASDRNSNKFGVTMQTEDVQ